MQKKITNQFYSRAGKKMCIYLKQNKNMSLIQSNLGKKLPKFVFCMNYDYSNDKNMYVGKFYNYT